MLDSFLATNTFLVIATEEDFHLIDKSEDPILDCHMVTCSKLSCGTTYLLRFRFKDNISKSSKFSIFEQLIELDIWFMPISSVVE